MTEGETKNATKKRKDKERIEELTGQKRVPLTGGETTLKSVILAHLTMGMSCLCFSFHFYLLSVYLNRIFSDFAFFRTKGSFGKTSY